MKKTTIFVLALLGLLVAAVPASAAPNTTLPVLIFSNPDIQAAAENITTATMPTQCYKVDVCHDNIGSKVMKVMYESSTPTGTNTYLQTRGFELYPPNFTAATGGDKCKTIVGTPFVNVNFLKFITVGLPHANGASVTCYKQ